MFLATTALTDFWDDADETIFLGWWCLREGDGETEQRGRNCIMPSPWSDAQRFASAAIDADECYEQLLSELGDYLNSLHGVSWSRRYWRVLVGPWLLHFVHAVYDRHVHLTDALRRYPGLRTMVLDPRAYRTPVSTLDALTQFAYQDAYNLQLYSELLSSAGYAFPSRMLESATVHRPQRPTGIVWRDLLKSGVRRAEAAVRRLCSTRWEIALCEMGMKHSEVWKLARAGGYRLLPVAFESQALYAPPPAFDERRLGLGTLRGGTTLGRTVSQLLPRHLPPVYLEGYAVNRERARRHARLPGVVVSSLGWYFNEPFKFAAAEASERGARLIAAIHGGGYGMFRLNPSQKHEEQLADTYLVWGDWAERDKTRYRKIPPPASSLVFPSRNDGGAPLSGILFLSTNCDRYLFRFHSIPRASLWADYFEAQERFVAAISPAVRPHITFRPHPTGHPRQARMTATFPEVTWSGAGSLSAMFAKSAVVVIDHPQTAMLASLTANRPTLLFWDRDLWEMCEDAEPYFESLRKARILMNTPEAAAAMLETIVDRPASWWESDEVQAARGDFLRQYADARPDWPSCWADTLIHESRRGSLVAAGRAS